MSLRMQRMTGRETKVIRRWGGGSNGDWQAGDDYWHEGSNGDWQAGNNYFREGGNGNYQGALPNVFNKNFLECIFNKYCFELDVLLYLLYYPVVNEAHAQFLFCI